MKTRTINVYEFKELSDEAKKKAIEKLSSINVDFEWWDATYMDAENIGLKITSFDLDRNRHAKGSFMESGLTTANKIITEHGDQCESYKTAKSFLDEYLPKREAWEKENEGWYFDDEDEGVDLRDEFLKSILEDYAMMLEKEYEYQTSREAIIESIEANEYEFDEEGNQI